MSDTFDRRLNPADALGIDHVRRRLEFVVKISKHCNLRCRYCYELHDLHKRDQMSLDDIESMFRNVASFVRDERHAMVHFIWHGGEPLLIKPSVYRQIAEVQARVFDGVCEVRNSLQTNLTVVSDEILAFVEEGSFIDGLGVSFDPFGVDRVDTRGRLRNDQVAANLQRVMDRGINVGAISVLSRGTIDEAVRTFRMFDSLQIQHRILPYYMSSDAAQASAHGLHYDEILEAFVDLFDAWLGSDNATPVNPIEEHRRSAEAVLAGKPLSYYDFQRDEFVFIVEVDGGIWGVMDAYEPSARYGSIFQQGLSEALASPARASRRQEIDARMARHCGPCPYFGHCPGQYVAHATAEERAMIDRHGCMVRELISHMLGRYRQTGLDALVPTSIAGAAEMAIAR